MENDFGKSVEAEVVKEKSVTDFFRITHWASKMRKSRLWNERTNSTEVDCDPRQSNRNLNDKN